MRGDQGLMAGHSDRSQMLLMVMLRRLPAVLMLEVEARWFHLINFLFLTQWHIYFGYCIMIFNQMICGSVACLFFSPDDVFSLKKQHGFYKVAVYVFSSSSVFQMYFSCWYATRASTSWSFRLKEGRQNKKIKHRQMSPSFPIELHYMVIQRY